MIPKAFLYFFFLNYVMYCWVVLSFRGFFSDDTCAALLTTDGVYGNLLTNAGVICNFSSEKMYQIAKSRSKKCNLFANLVRKNVILQFDK